MNDQPRTSWALGVRRYADIVIVIACLAAGAFVGSRYYREVYAAGGSKPWFYQVDFGPAVMWTCGHGFVLPDVAGDGGAGSISPAGSGSVFLRPAAIAAAGAAHRWIPAMVDMVTPAT
jgi:hypothetical protein